MSEVPLYSTGVVEVVPSVVCGRRLLLRIVSSVRAAFIVANCGGGEWWEQEPCVRDPALEVNGPVKLCLRLQLQGYLTRLQGYLAHKRTRPPRTLP